jgi:ABC-type methionine transport system ATPase subunit
VGGTALVEDVTIEGPEGAVFVVFGPPGAGKSTLLRLLNRLDEPTSGTVLLDGVVYRSLDPPPCGGSGVRDCSTRVGGYELCELRVV